MPREYALNLTTCITVSRTTKRMNTIYISEIDCILGMAWWFDDDELNYRVEEITFSTDAVYRPAVDITPIKFTDKYTVSPTSADERDRLQFASTVAEIDHGKLSDELREELIARGLYAVTSADDEHRAQYHAAVM
jgi:hypothetical protein